MRTFHRILRTIPGGGAPGELVDTTEWKYTPLLVGSHHLEPIEMAAAVKAPKCLCGRRWIDKDYLAVHQCGCETILKTATSEREPEPAA